jgi:hypothetical protein
METIALFLIVLWLIIINHTLDEIKDAIKNKN